MNITKILSVSFQIIVGVVFLHASFDKILDPETFAKSIVRYDTGALMFMMSNSIALVIPWIEFLVGFFLIFNIFKNTSINLVMILLIIFICLLLQAHLRGLDIESCGCTKSVDSVDDPDFLLNRIYQDIVLFIMILFVKYDQYIKLKIN
tara:strand:+ start:167 stop:613 length:447 start_codon:yes stop_codon:yes gene_type:complete